MVRKKKLENVGDPQDESEVVVTTETIEETMGGFAPGVEEQLSQSKLTRQSDPAPASQEDDDLDNVDEAATARQLQREKNMLLRDVGKIGEAFGAGKTSMISLAERIVEAAMAPAIGVKDAELIYDRFKEKADAKATLDDAGIVPDVSTAEKPAQVDDDKSKVQQLSKLRSFIKLGNTYQDDGLDIIRRARNIHLDMLTRNAGADRKAVKPGSTYTILVAVASHQVKNGKGVPLSDSDIEDYLSIEVKATEPATAAKKVLDALVAAEAAKKGGKERGPVNSPYLDAAIENLRSTLSEVNGGDTLLAEHEAKAKKKEAEAAEAVAAE